MRATAAITKVKGPRDRLITLLFMCDQADNANAGPISRASVTSTGGSRPQRSPTMSKRPIGTTANHAPIGAASTS